MESILIKVEPEDKIKIEDGPNFLDMSQIIKTEDNSHFEYSLTNFNNEGIKESTKSLNCKSEPCDSFENKNTVLNTSQMEVENIFDEENLVDLSKLKHLLNQTKNISEYSKIKHEDKEIEPNTSLNSFLDEEPNMKTEMEECDISEHPLQLFELDFTSEGKEHGERSDTFNVDEIIQEYAENFDGHENPRKSEPQEQRRGKKIKNKIHKCTLCSHQATIKSNLVRHINTAHNKNRVKLYCQFCDKSFAVKISLEDHQLKQHKGEINADLKSFITNKILACNFCNYETTRSSCLNEHINTLHNDQRIKKYCQFCDKSFALQKSLDNHMLNQHKDKRSVLKSKIIKCPKCSFETTFRNKLILHINSVHNKQRIQIHCQFCDKSFAKQQSVDDHVIKQHKENISLIKRTIKKCNFCSYQTIHKHVLEKHVNAMHNDNKQELKMNCQFCDKSFSLKYSLDDHLFKHHQHEINPDMKELISSKTHSCELCDYKSVRRDNLNKHINSVHNEHRIKNQCQFCDRLFALQGSLNLHLLNQHSNEISSDMKDLISSKMHTCNICSYKSIRKNHLNKHMNIHKKKEQLTTEEGKLGHNKNS